MSLQDFLFPSESFFFSRGACRVLLSLKDCFLRCLWEDGYLPAGSVRGLRETVTQNLEDYVVIF